MSYPKPTRVSFSSISTFESCPFSYKLYYLDGHKYEAGQAANRGTRLHTACERFLKGEININQLPIDFLGIKSILSILKIMDAKAEEVWMVNDRWEFQTEEDESTRFKAVVDIHYLPDPQKLVIQDLKTGRAYPEHSDQLQAYAVMGFSRYPDVEEVEVSALYLEGAGNQTTYNKALLPHLRQYWEARWEQVLGAVEYPATPSFDSCKYCGYKKSKGGQCEHG
jgi:hypothetical protein